MGTAEAMIFNGLLVIFSIVCVSITCWWVWWTVEKDLPFVLTSLPIVLILWVVFTWVLP